MYDKCRKPCSEISDFESLRPTAKYPKSLVPIAQRNRSPSPISEPGTTAAIFWNTGASGNWSVATNWSPNTVPNNTNDDVTINAAGTYTVTVDVGTDVGSFVFDAPTATISIPTNDFINMFGAATITGGTIDGPGMLFIASGTITSGPPVTLGGGLNFRISNGITVNDAGLIDIGDAAGLTATIMNSGAFNLTTDTAGIGLNTVNVGGSSQLGIGNLENSGTLAKTGGTGTSHISASYSGQGTVSVSTGTLEFDGPINTFNFGTLSGTGMVAFGAGSSQFNTNPTIANFLIDGGTVSFSNTLSYSGNFSETAGSLTLTDNPMFSGTFALSGGTVTFNAGNVLTLPNTTSFAGGTVTGGTIALKGNTTVTGGTTLIQAAVVDNGTIAVQGGRFDLGGGVSGNGQITISTGSALELGQASAVTQKVSFADSTGNLQLDQPGLFKSPILGFQRGDTIDAIGVTANSAVYSGGNLTLRNGGTTVLQLTVSTPYASPVFHLASDGHGGTAVTDSLPNAGSVTSDFNNDGMSDILLQNSSGQIFTWEMNGASIVGTGNSSNPGPSWHAIATGDFNDDGKADVLLQNSSGQVFVWELSGGNLIGSGSVANPGPSWHAIGAGDFNGDGKSNVLLQNSSGEVDIWELNGASVIAAASVANPGPSWHAISTGDFNGDGKSDILLQNDSGEVVVWEMNGSSVIGSVSLGNPGPSWHAVGTGDYNGDGHYDIRFQNSSGEAFIWELNGTALIGSGSVVNPGPSWHVVGDSTPFEPAKADLTWQTDGNAIEFENDSGQAAIWLMNGTTLTSGATPGNPGPS
jgi:hypothetical protein